MKRFTFWLLLNCCIFIWGGGNILAQACANNLSINPPHVSIGQIGIQTGALPLIHPLSIYGQQANGCDDVTFYLRNYPAEVAYDGLLALTTNSTWGTFTALETGNFPSIGNMVLRAGIIAKDIILTTRNSLGLGHIRFATTQFNNPAVDIERMTITPTGIVGININMPDASTKLEVNGKVRIDDLTQPGTYMVTSDGNGILGKQQIPPSLNSWLLDGNAGTTYTNFLGTTDNQRIVIKTNNYERLRITPDGRIGVGFYEFHWKQPVGKMDINLGSWGPNALPRISFSGCDSGNPSIRFYRPTGNDTSEAGLSFPWWIETSDLYGGSMRFRTRNTDLIGIDNEQNMITKVTIINNGNVGINNEDPQAKLQVTDGKVVFDGNANDGNSIPTGAGTRFMWIPEKGTLAAGSVDGTQWNTVGANSAIFGMNNIVQSDYSAIFGLNNSITTNDSWNDDANLVVGEENIINRSDECFISGTQDTIYQSQDCAIFGFGNKIELGNCAFVTGWYNVLKNLGPNTPNAAIGKHLTVIGGFATGMGWGVQTNNMEGAFIIGDRSYDPQGLPQGGTKSNNKNQLTLRFTGDPNKGDNDGKPDPNNVVFRLITACDDNTQGNFQEIDAYYNGNGWIGSSDSNLKRNILPVDNNDILYRLRQVPIKTWEWKGDSVYVDSLVVWDSISYRWMGPMAQDFYQQFPIGIPDSTKLSWATMDAVAIASVQALADVTDSLKSGELRNWHKSGDSISSNDFIGTTNNQPLVIKTNSFERLKVSDDQITFHFAGVYDSTLESITAYKLYSDTNQTTGVFLAGGETGWRALSDKNKKEDFKSIDETKILESISRIPVTTWVYKNAPRNIRYIGPMAQDFYSEFKLGGTDSLSINSVIFDGLNFSAIKALISLTGDLKKKLDSAASKNDLKDLNDSLSGIKSYFDEKAGELKKKFDSSFTRSEFISFRDSIKCYANLCGKIKELEDKIESLQMKLDSIMAKDSSITKRFENTAPSSFMMPYDDIILEQNRPNPFDESSIVSYYIPAKYDGAIRLIITDESGVQIFNEFEACKGKPCQENISAKNLKTGIYLYGIKLNGYLVKFSKMMVIK